MIMAALGDNPALIGRYLATLGSLLATFFLLDSILFIAIKKNQNDNLEKVLFNFLSVHSTVYGQLL